MDLGAGNDELEFGFADARSLLTFYSSVVVNGGEGAADTHTQNGNVTYLGTVAVWDDFED